MTDVTLRLLSRRVLRAGPILGLLAIWVLFAVLCGAANAKGEGSFLAAAMRFVSWDNQRLMLLQTAVIGVAAIGATAIIITGGIDLSVGALIALCTVVVATLLREGASTSAAALGGVLAGIAAGAITGGTVIGHFGRVATVLLSIGAGAWLGPKHGPIVGVGVGLFVGGACFFLTERFLPRVELSPFIVTLGMWGALRGAAKGLAGNQPVYAPASGLNEWMMHGDGGLTAILPIGVWALLALAVLTAAALRFTRLGRHIFAVGSNEATARLCGVDVARTKLLAYAFGGACAGVAGCLQYAYLSMGDPTTADGYELKVIASVVIGGASLSGGEGGVVGTIVGALIMTVVDNGCTKLGLDNWVQEIVTGGIIVAAVVIDRLRYRRLEA